jgi:hypothetical protein
MGGDSLMEEELLTADGFDKAMLGITKDNIAVYSVSKAIHILIDRDGMDYEEALEFLEFNTIHTYVGEQTPIWVYTTNN